MSTTPPSIPLALVAELTHRCPLHCVYGSNPLELAKTRIRSFPTQNLGARAFKKRRRQVSCKSISTGGEPLARTDIVELVPRRPPSQASTSALITSGLPLDEARTCRSGWTWASIISS